jgi:hypothetical protein
MALIVQENKISELTKNRYQCLVSSSSVHKIIHGIGRRRVLYSEDTGPEQRAGVLQSVQLLTTCWTTERSKFESR